MGVLMKAQLVQGSGHPVPILPAGLRHRSSCLRPSVRCHASESSGEGPTATALTAQPGLIFGSGESGAWDEIGVAHPVVRYYLGDNEKRWFMWYTGRSPACHNADAHFPSSGSVGVAVSSDGVRWSRGAGAVEGSRGAARSLDVGRVLAPNEDWWWHDTCHLHASDVQILSNSSVDTGVGVYWCFYSGGSFEVAAVPEALRQSASGAEVAEGLRLRPGLAMSQDGRNWARIEADHHTGALFDVGAEGEWDALFVGSPQVVAAGPRDMRMYYHSFDVNKGKYVVGVAISADGFKWEKGGPLFEGGSSPGDFDALGAASRCVVRDIDTKSYFMFYEAVAADNSRSIGVAVSRDGLTGWRRHPAPVLAAGGEPGAWDGGCVGTPWAVSMAQGRWRLYYAGREQVAGGAWQGIGLALSEDGGASFEGAPTGFRRRCLGGANE